jgi:protein SCO1
MNTPQQRSLLEPKRVGALALIVAVLAATIALGLPRITSNEAPEPEVLAMDRKQGVDPPRELADFTLTDQDGAEARLSDFEGRPLLMFFGFTHCPDICPATMAEFRIIKRELGDLGSDVTFMLISVDGSRDTPDAIRAYVRQFDDDFVGLTGDEDYVREIGLEYFLYFNRAAGSDTTSEAGYSVDHTAFSYLIDQDGRLTTIYPFQAPRDMIVQDLRDMISSSSARQ